MLGIRVGYWSRCQRRRFAGGASVRGGQCLAVVPASLIRCHANSSIEPDRHYAAGTRPGQSLSSWTDGRLFLSVQSALGGRGIVLGPSRQTLRDNKKRPMQLRAARVGCRTFVLRATGGGAATTQPCAERRTQLFYCTASANITQGTVEFKPPPA